MSKTSSAPQYEPEHPPLARDALGNLLPIPNGTFAWRICRHTGGRPRELCGPDRQAIRFPLTTTIEELVDLCGPDVYRIYALDELGQDLGHIATVHAERERELRNAGGIESPLLAALHGPSQPTSDLRFALEALTHIARINGEALRSVSEAQADWVKAIAMAKGLPRNVAFPAPGPPRDDDDDDDDQDEEPDPPAPSPAPQGGIESFLGHVGPILPGLYEMWRGEEKAKAEKQSPAVGMLHLAQIQAQLTPREQKFLEILLADPANGANMAKLFASQTVNEAVAMVRVEANKVVTQRSPAANDEATRIAPPPPAAPADPDQIERAFKEKAIAIAALLEPADNLRLIRLASKLRARIAEPAIVELVQTVAPMSVEDAANWLKQNLDEIERRLAS